MKQQKSSLVIHLDISRDVVVFDLKLFVVLNISTFVFKQKNKRISTRSLSQEAENVPIVFFTLGKSIKQQKYQKMKHLIS